MTLDNLTRAQAESKHLKLKNSLAQASAEFREQFKDEHALFRSLPDSPRSGSLAPSPTPHASPHDTAAVRALTSDLVRLERINQCCKRVRVWRRQIANPLVQYRNQLLFGNKAGTTKKNDRRMHITLLMSLIVDVYEQRMNYEIEEGSSSTAGIQETFPEFVVRVISQRASNRRSAVDQLTTIITTVLQTSSGTHLRVHLFGSLCGLDDSFNPPEKIKVFLHVLERLHRWKAHASNVAAAAGSSIPRSFADDSAMSDVVFHTIGTPQHVVHKVVAELFQDDFYWNFQFWHAQCCELHVVYRWPSGAVEELQERALNLAASSRNILLNSMRKIDGDAFLALLMDVWTQRAQEICVLLEHATDAEEARGAKLLQQRQQTQDERANVLPLAPSETAVFELLVDEFWNADVPWTSAKVRTKLAPVAHLRPLHELEALYVDYVRNLDESRKCWSWQTNWRWEVDWEWGVLHIQEDNDDAA
uniref:Uncharacterized protein n=1 Tax=Globisporangium ultimum (strain ATCC 200006 / CBS 805.95 / DAOM BR144) TaxID=431595 RepID=K3X9Z1_GLOUD